MIGLLLEKISQKKSQLFPLLFPNPRNSSSGVPFLSVTKTTDLQRQALLGRMTRGFFHDLLNPLSAVQLYMGHLQHSMRNSEYSPIVKDIHKELCAFITTIQFNLGNPDVTNEVCFHELCITASTLLKHKLTEKNIRIKILGDRTLNLMTQSLYIIQIITNGLSNAIDAFVPDHQSERKEVTLSYQQIKDRFIITIHDNGIGIPQHLQKDIFDPYISTKEDGHRIGLATTKDIVTRIFKGKISLESEEGKGTTLTVDLPTDLRSPEDPGHSSRDQKS
jgi:signal transduction histidine kinase